MTDDDRTPEALTRRAHDLTRADRRSDHRLFWLELLAVALVAGVLVVRWIWLI
ncbi:hypothetical protein [Streptomyces sp. WG-D5]